VIVSDGLCIARKELQELLRDRRALFFAFVLPLLLYPALFFGFGRIEGMRREAASANPSRIGLAGGSPAVLARLASDPDLEARPTPPQVELLERGELDALLEMRPDPAAAAGALPPAVIYFQGGVPASLEARRRLEKALDEYQDELLAARFAERGGSIDPARLVQVAYRDLADSGEQAGAGLGLLLPFILVALLLTGGAFAAIDLIAGEKERGTLETLFIQPVAGRSVVLGKFLAVLAASLAAVVLNLLGMGGAVLLGLGPSGGAGPRAIPPLAALATALLLMVPLAVLTSAVLLSLSAYARTVRQAQMVLFPLTLVSILPALLAAFPEARLSAALSVVPIANTALAIREALVGEYRWLHLGATFVSTSLYAALALGWAARLLEREDLRLGLEPDAALEGATGAARARRGMVFGAFMVLLIAYGGSAAQREDGPLTLWGGLAFTLWVLVLLPSLLYLKVFRLPARETLALRAPSWRSLLAAVAMVPPVAVLMTGYLAFQDSVLPYPEGLRSAMEKLFAPENLGAVSALFLIGLSPAVCEEVLCRGVIQGEVSAEGRPLKTLLGVGILFGLLHLSAYRIVPTTALGVLLAYLRLSSGSIFPCMVLHGLYNSAMLFGFRLGPERLTGWATRPEVELLAALLLAGLVRWMWLHRPPAEISAPPASS
jgi:sodium transport system permease protein